MTDRDSLLEQLRQTGAGSDAEIKLAETALVLAALDRPAAQMGEYLEHLALLAEATASAAGGAVALADRARAIREAVFVRHGYAGDSETYDDMQNANLMRVIDRRKGLPVALGILCIHAARAQGWDMVGINFPSHFLTLLRSGGESAVVDPFNAARILNQAALLRRLRQLYGPGPDVEPMLYRPVGNRDILLRLQNNIRLRALAGRDTARAAAVLEAMTLLAPDQGDLRLELAVLQAQDGRLRSAIAGLEAFLARPGAATGSGDAAELLRSLRSRLN